MAFYDDGGEERPIDSGIRYVLWYFDKNGLKNFVHSTHDFDKVKNRIGDEHPLNQAFTINSRNFLTIEELNIKGKWKPMKIYTKHNNEEIVVYYRCKGF